MTSNTPSILQSQPELVDPLTITISYLANPGPFRSCCLMTTKVWDQAVYLEGELPCASVTSSATRSSCLAATDELGEEGEGPAATLLGGSDASD